MPPVNKHQYASRTRCREPEAVQTSERYIVRQSGRIRRKRNGVQVKVQTVPGYAKGLTDGMPKVIAQEGVGGYVLLQRFPSADLFLIV